MSAHEQERLSGYLDDELPADERAAVEAHLGQCGECRERLAELATVDAAARAGRVRAPEGYFDDFAGRVRRRIEAEPLQRPRSWRPPVWAWAVAAGLVLAVLSPLTLRRAPAPPAPPPAAPVVVQSAPPAVAAEKPRAAERQATPPPARARAAKVQPLAPAERPAVAATTLPLAPPPPEVDLQQTVAVGGGVTRNEATAAPAPPAGAAGESEAKAKEQAFSATPRQAADRRASLDVTPAAAVPEFQVEAAASPRTGDADAGFRRLERIHPTDVAGWRALREGWRGFAESHPTSKQADEARVRAVAAGLELLRLGGGPGDAATFRADASAYLSRQDAAQKPRVRALLEAAGPSR